MLISSSSGDSQASTLSPMTISCTRRSRCSAVNSRHLIDSLIALCLQQFGLFVDIANNADLIHTIFAIEGKGSNEIEPFAIDIMHKVLSPLYFRFVLWHFDIYKVFKRISILVIITMFLV